MLIARLWSQGELKANVRSTDVSSLCPRAVCDCHLFLLIGEHMLQIMQNNPHEIMFLSIFVGQIGLLEGDGSLVAAVAVTGIVVVVIVR